MNQKKEDAIRASVGKITRCLKPDELDRVTWEIINSATEKETSKYVEAFS